MARVGVEALEEGRDLLLQALDRLDAGMVVVDVLLEPVDLDRVLLLGAAEAGAEGVSHLSVGPEQELAVDGPASAKKAHQHRHPNCIWTRTD